MAAEQRDEDVAEVMDLAAARARTHHTQSLQQGALSRSLAGYLARCGRARHLFGVHSGSIRASGTADHLRSGARLRDGPCLVVEGRERLAE